jgi:DNA polymerase-3 subunit beta
MKLKTTKQSLVEALSVSARATSTRSALQALSGVLVEATSSGTVVRATDAEISLELALTAEVELPGSILVPGRLLADVSKTLPDGDVTLSTREAEADLEIKAGSSKFHLRLLQADDFPKFPEVASEPVSLDAHAVAETIGRVAGAASTDEGRPVLTGVFMTADGDSMTMVATDSYRLAVKTTKLSSAVASQIEANVPARALRELSRLIEAAGGEAKLDLWLGENQAIFGCGGTRLASRLIDGQFPNYKQLIPDKFDHEITVNREELLDVVRRVSQLAQRNAALKLAFAEGELTISAETQDLGDAKESMPVSFQGEALEVGFNPDFVRAGLESIEDDEIVFKLISPLRPGLLEPTADGDFSYLVMPIRLND